jgi:hypothetical protein
MSLALVLSALSIGIAVSALIVLRWEIQDRRNIQRDIQAADREYKARLSNRVTVVHDGHSMMGDLGRLAQSVQLSEWVEENPQKWN